MPLFEERLTITTSSLSLLAFFGLARLGGKALALQLRQHLKKCPGKLRMKIGVFMGHRLRSLMYTT